MFKYIYTTVLDALFPLQCAGCKQYGEPICAPCLSNAAEIQHITAEPGDSIQQVVTLGNYSQPLLQHAIRQLKFHGVSAMAKPLGHALGAAVALSSASHCQGDPLLLPIPLHAQRLRERGYNQAELLASAMSSELGWPVAAAALQRDTTKYRQADLAHEERWKHVQGIFHVAPGQQSNLRGKDIWIVDDVITTGATAVSAVSTLIAETQSASISLCAIARGS